MRIIKVWTPTQIRFEISHPDFEHFAFWLGQKVLPKSVLFIETSIFVTFRGEEICCNLQHTLFNILLFFCAYFKKQYYIFHLSFFSLTNNQQDGWKQSKRQLLKESIEEGKRCVLLYWRMTGLYCSIIKDTFPFQCQLFILTSWHVFCLHMIRK